MYDSGSTRSSSGSARFDRYGTRSTSRYVRVEGDRSSPVVDLSDATRRRSSGSTVPRVAGPSSSRRSTAPADSRFAPANPRTRSLAERAQSRNPGRTRIRTTPVTRESILERYRGPSTSTAPERPRSAERADAGRTSPSKERVGRRSLAQRDASGLRAEPSTRANGGRAERHRGTWNEKAGRPSSARDSLRRAATRDPERARRLTAAGDRASRFAELGVKTAVNVGLGFSGSPASTAYWDPSFATPNDCYNWYFNAYWPAFGNCFFGNAYYTWLPWSGLYYPSYFGFGFGFGSFYSNWCYPYGGWGWGFGYRSIWWPSRTFWGGNFATIYIDDNDYGDGFDQGYDSGFRSGFDEGVAATGGFREAPVVYEGEGVVSAPLEEERPRVPAPQQSPITREELSRAASHYLSVGDTAFQEGRYADAVHFYAKAVEFAPDEGVLYMILSDALFATGDYHYAAYSLRKALELDPTLTEGIVDKHTFYTDPAEFDRQLAVLERFLEDHFLDDDARLLLAANYLFGNRPAAAVDLLESTFSKTVRESPAGQRILEAARSVQYGTGK